MRSSRTAFRKLAANQFRLPPSRPRRIEPKAITRDGIIVCGSLLAILGGLFLFMLRISDILLGNPLGGPLPSAPFNSEHYGIPLEQLAASIADTDITAVFGLFGVTAFALTRDRNHRHHHMFWKVWPLSVFVLSAILTIFFALKFKTGLLIQMQYDHVDVELLGPAFSWHLICLLAAGLSCFCLLLLSVGPFSRPQKGKK